MGKKPHFKYYKNKYQIALYDENETLCHLFDNPKEMAKALKGSAVYTDKYYSKLSRLHKSNKIRHRKRWYYIELIEVEDDKEQQLYERLCVGCPRERICHETCETCEEYEEELFKIENNINE